MDEKRPDFSTVSEDEADDASTLDEMVVTFLVSHVSAKGLPSEGEELLLVRRAKALVDAVVRYVGGPDA